MKIIAPCKSVCMLIEECVALACHTTQVIKITLNHNDENILNFKCQSFFTN